MCGCKMYNCLSKINVDLEKLCVCSTTCYTFEIYPRIFFLLYSQKKTYNSFNEKNECI